MATKSIQFVTENFDPVPAAQLPAPPITTGTSGEAITLGYAVGIKNASGTPKVYKASAASGATPLVCTGIAYSTAAGADVSISVQASGLSPVIPDAAWDALPAVTDVDKPVYLSKTAGKLTIDISAFLAADSKQSIGTLAVGGTGACRVLLSIGSPSLSRTLAELGGQPVNVVVHDAAFNAASVTVSGLSAAKRYRIILQADYNGANEIFYLQPNGADAGCGSNLKTHTASSYYSALAIGNGRADTGGNPHRIYEVTVNPRRNGLSEVHSIGHSNLPEAVAEGYIGMGATSTDFTSLTFLVSAGTRTGWLTVIEETP